MDSHWKIVAVAILIMIIGCIGVGTRSYAYTEEEKQQAKAWLSAHGYSPDAGGAAQAYQDYLDGKFNDELGITDDAATESTDPQDTTDVKNENENQENDSDNGSKNRDGDDKEAESVAGSVWDIVGSSTTEHDESSDDNDIPVTESTTEIESETDDTITETDEYAEERQEDYHENDHKDNITLYQRKNADQYKEAILVVVFGVMIVAIGMGIVVLLK